jgi:phosphatidylglycerol lysyltransferase
MTDQAAATDSSRAVWLRFFLPRLLGVVLFGLAIWFIHHELARWPLSDLLEAAEGLPARAIMLALLATALGYATLTMFDALALRYLGKDLHFHRTALASFIGYAFAHGLGFAILSGGAVRYRLYSAWGLSALEIGAIVAFNSMTTFLGLASLIGLACLGAPGAIGALLGVPAAVITAIGMALAAVVVGYHGLTIVVRAPLRVRRWQLRLPSPALALLQTLISLLDWSLAAFALYVLLPADLSLGFFVLLGIFALANLGGLLSHVPGGIGVFEGLMLLAIPSEGHAAGVAAALIAYRLIYYLLPLLLAALLLGVHQLLTATDAVERPKRARPATIAASIGR